MYCSNCGKEIKVAGKFCIVCGTQIIDIGAENENESNYTQEETTVRGDFVGDTTTTKEKFTEGVVLTSAEDIEGSIDWGILGSVVGIVLLMIVISKASDIAALGLLAVSLCLVYVAIMFFQALFFNQALDKKRFAIVPSADCEIIMRIISDGLVSGNEYSAAMKNGQIIIENGITTYTIILNDDSTFSIIWDNILKRFGKRAPFAITNQRSLVKNYGIIVYTIQQKLGITK